MRAIERRQIEEVFANQEVCPEERAELLRRARLVLLKVQR
jgi:hypothetical protein